MSKFQDLTGRRFGRLVALRPNGNDKYKNVIWLCKCDCGNECCVVGASLRRGKTGSCVCYRKTNRYEIKDSITQIYFASGDVALIDTEDIEIVSKYQWKIVGGYARTKIDDKTISMHRLITKAEEGFVVDHINHNGLDNRKSNLRICTQSNNAMNRKKPINNTS